MILNSFVYSYNTNVVKCSDGSIDVYDSDGEIINFDSGKQMQFTCTCA